MRKNSTDCLKKANKLFFVLLLIFSIALAGCTPALRKKFIRPRKKKEKQEEVIYQTREYVKENIPVDEYYKEHYIFWKSWQEELIKALGTNSRKLQVRSLSEAIINLNAMKDILGDEKGAALETHIALLEEIDGKISGGYLSSADIKRLKRTLTRQKKEIVREFSYNKVSQWIRE